MPRCTPIAPFDPAFCGQQRIGGRAGRIVLVAGRMGSRATTGRQVLDTVGGSRPAGTKGDRDSVPAGCQAGAAGRRAGRGRCCRAVAAGGRWQGRGRDPPPGTVRACPRPPIAQRSAGNRPGPGRARRGTTPPGVRPSCFTGALAGLRDRALLSVMLYSFARVSAVLGMRRQDYFGQGSRGWLRLHEKGGKRHDVPAHHRAAAALDAYV